MSTTCGLMAHVPMPRKASAWWIVAVALLGTNAWTQTGPPDQDSISALDALTPGELIAAIEANNPDLLSAAAAAEAAALRVEPAGALADPMFTYAIAPDTIGSDINTRNIGQLSQQLPWPGKRGLRESVAAHRAEAAVEELNITRLDLVASAQRSFAEWHFLHRAIEINDASREILVELTRVAEARYAAGRASQQDVLQAELEALMLEERQLALDHERIGLRARINALLAREPSAPLPPPAGLVAVGPLPAIEALRGGAESGHPEIRRSEAQVAAANAERDLADKAFLPDFGANLGYVGTLDPSEKRFQIGVTINIPLYREKRRAELDATNADLRRSQYALTARRLEILAELESAYTHTHHAMEVVRLYETRLLELAQSNLDAALTDYRSGAGAFINVVTAERQLLDTQQRYERARADYWRMRADLERATGGMLSAGAASAAMTVVSHQNN
jgi:outer membrane protein, heavy metal efflux system